MISEAIRAAPVSLQAGEIDALYWAAARTRQPRDADPFMFSMKSRAEFENLFLPHLDAAFNLARALTRNTEDAEDVVQESYLKAWRAFAGFRGGSPRPWLLAIVRNHAFTWLRENRPWAESSELREESLVSGDATPEALSLRRERSGAVERCVQELLPDFREAIILREMEELSYREIAIITGVPRGTVMSRLSRARARLAECLKRSGGNTFPEGRSRQ